MEDNTPKPSFSDDIDSCSSTPFVSAPSSPGREIIPPLMTGFYYSAPSSPMHFVLSTSSLKSHSAAGGGGVGGGGGGCFGDSAFEFDLPSSGAATADELFFNGQIRPMKLSTHLQQPQLLDPLIESDENENETHRGREITLRAGSLRRRTRSMSPMRNSFQWDGEKGIEDLDLNLNIDNERNADENVNVKSEEENKGSEETTPCASRSSSAGRNSSSRRWVFLKELLYRSKSEGRNHEGQHKFWGFSPVKEKKPIQPLTSSTTSKGKVKKNVVGKKSSPSPHEVHYTTKRAQAEEMKRRTFLPYRQGLLGCLGFSSKGYGAMNGFARALNPVSSS